MLLVVLRQLACHQMEDSTEDEIMLRSGGAQVFPNEGEHVITAGNSAFMEKPIISAGDVNVELWEEDWPDPDDYLGTVTIPANATGARTGEFTRDEAHYTLHYTAVQF
ncbi:MULTISPECIES: hypothetical protein [Streptomyces]|nr:MULTISPECIES: hypothetical protein [Streptomyces]MZD16951.1 hypothetical protein [Streptomyces sp. SID5476]